MTTLAKVISSEADSLMDLLVAQCADLESLLVLARREAVAAENRDFEELMTITRDRATLGERLESYHRQVSELRATMGTAAGQVIESTIAKDTIRIAMDLQCQDERTASLLNVLRRDSGEAIARIEVAHRNAAAYLSDTRASGLNCDQIV